MQDTAELKILFATKFTSNCFSAIRAVAQLANTFRLSVTIARVDSGDPPPKHALQSFFAEADHYASCRRVQLHGDPVQAIADLARNGEYDLVLAPRSSHRGIPRPLHRSKRAALLRCGNVPVWTGALWLESADFMRPYRTIAVGIDGRDDAVQHVKLAASFAARLGAELRLLTVVPTVHEGTLISSGIAPEPLSADVAVERLRELFGGWSQMPTVDVAVGAPEKEIARMAGRCGADLLFLTAAQCFAGVFSRQISRTVDDAPCGVIAVPPSATHNFNWTFTRIPPHAPRLTPGLERQPAGPRLVSLSER